jgi:hypothetical protein
MKISISRDGVEIGEWTEEEVRVFYSEGRLAAKDHYWKEGMTEWAPLAGFIKPPPPFPVPHAIAVPIPTPEPMAALPPPIPEKFVVGTPPVNPTPEKKQRNWNAEAYGCLYMALSILGMGIGLAIAKSVNQVYPLQEEYMFYGALIGAGLSLIPFRIWGHSYKSLGLKGFLWIGVAVGALLALAISPILMAREFNATMQEASDTLNKKCPMMVDSMTRLDSTSIGPNRKFIYHYTLLGSTTFDTDGLKEELTPVLIKGWQTNPSIKMYREYGVTLEYDYFYESGTPITSVVFNAGQVPH